MTESLIAGGLFTVFFGSLLVFGFATGKMPTPVVPTIDAYRDETPGDFWALAALNALGLFTGVTILTRTLLGV